MAKLLTLAFGGHQEAFINAFVAAVRKVASEEQKSLASLFAEAPHLLKRFQHVSNTRRPIWDRRVTQNVFDSFDRQIFARRLSEAERHALRTTFEKTYCPEVRTDRTSLLNPKYVQGKEHVVSAFSKLLDVGGVSQASMSQDAGVFVDWVKSTITGLLSENRIGDAAVASDTIAKHLRSHPNEFFGGDEVALAATVASVLQLGIGAMLAAGDVHKLNEVANQLEGLFKIAKDKTVQVQALLAREASLGQALERLLFHDALPDKLAEALGAVCAAVQDRVVELCAQAVWLTESATNQNSYFDASDLRDVAVLRFANTRSFQKSPALRFSDQVGEGWQIGLDRMSDILAERFATGVLDGSATGHIEVQLLLAMANAHLAKIPQDRDGKSIVLQATHNSKMLLTSTGGHEHLPWIMWYQTAARVCGVLGLGASEMQAYLQIERLYEALRASSRIPALAKKRNEIVLTEFANRNIRPTKVSSTDMRNLEAIVQFIVTEPPSLT